MSSEDSDGEPGTGSNTGRLFRIKRLPWRSTELTEWLHRVDRMPTKSSSGAVLAEMATYRNRVPSDLESQARPPVKGLPRNLYKTDWMRLQSKRAAKEVGLLAVDVPLPRIDDFTPVSLVMRVMLACPNSRLLRNECAKPALLPFDFSYLFAL
jgi:hypothetical protein